jgi:arylsulfatase A-like enzyme
MKHILINRMIPFLACVGTGFPLSLSGAEEATASDNVAKLNIVLIVADDLGVGDVGCYGDEGRIPTPNLDRLASQGVRALDAHATSAVCTPSRFAMITGTYYWQEWIGELLVDTKKPTIASVFRDNGYATGYFGKWHLGWGDAYEGRRHRQDIDWNSELPEGVLECGFDTYFGTPFSHNEPPQVFVHDRKVVDLEQDDPMVLEVPNRLDPNPKIKGFGFSSGAKAAHAARPVDRIDPLVTEKVVEYIKANAERPFFVNFALVAPHVPIAPSPDFKGKTGIGDYPDFISQMDWCIGQVLLTLEDLGLEDNTMVIFTSDNGAVMRRDMLEILHRSNQDRLGQKTDAWEGGVRVPFIARWPGYIPAGTTTESLISLSDLARTVWTAAGIKAPKGAAPISLNQLPVLMDPGAKAVRREMLYLGTNEPHIALRSGDWVLMPGQGSFGLTTAPGSSWLNLSEMRQVNSDIDADGRIKDDAPQKQLYNLREDIGQHVNVISDYPEKAAELQKRYDALFKELL